MRNKVSKEDKVQMGYLSLIITGALLTIATGVFFVGFALVAVLLHMMFRDSMNLIQLFPFWGSYKYRLYWIFENAAPYNPYIPVALGKGTVYHNMVEYGADYYFVGRGVVLRLFRWTFQVGYGHHGKIEYRELDVPTQEIRKGVEGVWEEDHAVS